VELTDAPVKIAAKTTAIPIRVPQQSDILSVHAAIFQAVGAHFRTHLDIEKA
jgi:hypothetical protein